MLEMIQGLVKDKSEIVKEEIMTVKMFVPFSFNLVDGKCEDDEVQKLYDFLCERDDVIEETEDELEGETTSPVDEIVSPLVPALEDWQK